MKLYPFPETRGFRWLFILFFTLIFLLCRDTMIAMNMVGFAESQLLTLVLFMAAGLLFLWQQRKNLKAVFTDPRIFLMLAVTAVMLLPVLVKQDFQTMYFSILFYILASVFLSYFVRLDQASRVYVEVLSVLAVYSVLCNYILRPLADSGVLPIPIYYNDQCVNFYNFGLAHVSVEFVINRNFGMFREPGVYQFFLLVGLLLNNYVVQWKRSWQYWTVNIILSLTMLSTFATGGVLELLLLAVFLFFDKKWYRKKLGRWIAGLLILAGCGGVAWILLTENSLYVDFVGMITKFASPDSGIGRMHAILVDLMTFLHHPLVGDRMWEVLHMVDNNTTSSMVMLASMGILGGSLHVLAWAALIWDSGRKWYANLFLMLILFMSFNTQNLSWDLIFWLFPMMALVERGLPWLMKKRGEHRGA